MANIQKTAIVTGGSQGIGAGVVKAFLDRGYNVVANSRNITKANPFPRKAAQRNSSGVGAELDVEAGRKAARLAAKDLVTGEGVNGGSRSVQRPNPVKRTSTCRSILVRS